MDTNEKFIELDADFARAIKWTHSASAKPSMHKPQLEKAIVVTEDKVIACDGYRIHETKLYLGDLDVEPGVYKMETPRKGINKLVPSDESYPDLEDLKSYYAHEPTLEICVDPKLLLEALKNQSGKVKLSFCNDKNPMKVFGELGDGTETYALIMPMDCNKD
jgi:hypothetical protein